ncbi:spondin domain-containing protein [Colwellia psychrerythraea]|uniref:Spondin domain-containing protein n=1 Tax=Colwellia psychrerythraea TaxID=28229 RepID=A0A099KW66_COLPS|nr:spondin domain-containing protein [Colwellia psychrerythraea]KGJ94979.1 Spondin domain-containing protein [Colwellia psychrerythraea]
MLTFTTHKKITNKLTQQLLLVSLLTLGLAACNDSDNDNSPEEVVVVPVTPAMEYSYSLTLTNLTYGQPLSPVAVTLHGDTRMWQVGQAASVALEKLAESGDNTDFISLEDNLASTSAEGPLLPGSSVTLNISTTEPMADYLTVVTMLVNTNDAFSGLTGVDISTLALNQEKSWRLNVYDSGTEKNNEAVGTIPGPADGGVGYDSTRDDIDLVGYHPGVVSKDDGLSSSVLTQAHRFDNPAVKLTITRTK